MPERQKPEWNQFGSILASWMGVFGGAVATAIVGSIGVETGLIKPENAGEVFTILFVVFGLTGVLVGPELYSKYTESSGN